jgi:hypothetical protein
LIDNDNDLKIVKGSIQIGETTMQDAFLALSMNQGELKEDPIVGINLLTLIRGGAKREKIRKEIEIGLQRVGIKLDDIKEQIDLMIKT